MADDRLRTDRAIVVEGRDDANAVSRACDALIIATSGFGISEETWRIIEKAYNEKGIIILTDPDYSGEEIRRRIAARFPEAVHAYVAREDATAGDDIGIENSKPAVIAEAIQKALGREKKSGESQKDEKTYADMRDLAEMGLAGGAGSADRRARVCRQLGIGYANARAMITKLRGFGIDIDELSEAVKKIQ